MNRPTYDDSITLSFYEATIILKLFYRLILFPIVMMILSHYPYKPITIIGRTLYSDIIASIIDDPMIGSRHNENKALVTINNKNLEILFLDPIYNDNLEVKLIGLTNDELIRLEHHTGIRSLKRVHDQLLSQGITKVNKKLRHSSRIVNLKCFYSVSFFSDEEGNSWISSITISDDTHPPMIDENLVLLEYQDEDLSPVTTLDRARPFYFRGVYYLHPFHLPSCQDPIISLMIVSKVINDFIKK